MDIALIVDKLMPNAEYSRADDYETLQRTWTDVRPIPTEQEIIDAEASAMADDADRGDLPTLWEVAEALLSSSADASLNSIKARISTAKVAGTKL